MLPYLVFLKKAQYRTCLDIVSASSYEKYGKIILSALFWIDSRKFDTEIGNADQADDEYSINDEYIDVRSVGLKPAFFNKRRAQRRELTFFDTWELQVRPSDNRTPSSLKEDTDSTGQPEMKTGLSQGNLYLKKDTTISLHFFGFNIIPRL